MLVDSHCHLDFPDFAAELDAVVARARAAGIGRMVTISTRVKQHAQVLAIAERFPDVFCSVGTHPHHAHEELDIDDGRSGRRARSIRRSWRSARPGSTITTTTARATRRSRASAPTSRRRARPACRWSSIRATPTTTWRASCEEEMREGRLPGRAALLHRRPRSGLRGDRARPLRLVHRHPDLQEFRRAARHRGRRCRPTASWSRPTRPISRRGRTAASATSRPTWSRPPRCWPRRAASRSTRSRGRPPRISSGCSARCRARLQRPHDA